MAGLKNTKRFTKIFQAVMLTVLIFVGMFVVLPSGHAAAAETADLCRQHYTGTDLENCLIQAQDNPTGKTLTTCEKDQRARLFGIIPKWYKYLPYEEVDGKCTVHIELSETNAQGKNVGVNKILPIGLAIIEMLLSIAGVVSVVFVMIGGFYYITSQGEPENTKSARNTIVNALIGGALAIIATAVVNFIGGRFN